MPSPSIFHVPVTVEATVNGDGEFTGNAANDATITIVVYYMTFATGL